MSTMGQLPTTPTHKLLLSNREGFGWDNAVLHVMVAQHNAVDQSLAVRMLENRGHRCTVAGNGREVLDALEKDAFDLVFMDV
jgi:PleD family two-component response regulator